ncbi:MAG: DNA mismatch repair protein, partial [uncultured bacterium]
MQEEERLGRSTTIAYSNAVYSRACYIVSVKRKILKLDPTLVNQIAAGEVVENPSSIVKELMENSIDAGSKVITIDILQGGLELIRVEDDGFGMGPEDALLSIERHATSKIRSLEDFHALTSLGFRGEALAAISSVSRFELKTSDGQEATRVTLTHSEPCARNQGTTIEVRNLFYNV